MKKLPLAASQVYLQYWQQSRDKHNEGELDIKCPITKDRFANWPCNAYAVVYENFDEFEMMQRYVADQKKVLNSVLPMAEAIDQEVSKTSEYVSAINVREFVEQQVKMAIKEARAKLIDAGQTVQYRIVGQNKAMATEPVYSIEAFKNGQQVLLGFSTTAELASQIGYFLLTSDEEVKGYVVRDKSKNPRVVDVKTVFDLLPKQNNIVEPNET